MEFFLFLEDDPTDCCLFRITPTEPEPTFQNVIEKFLELYQKNHEISIEANKYSLFYDDLTYPLLNHKINKVEDLSKSVFSLKSNHFDLILSTTEPDTFYYEEEDAYEENNSTLQEFDEIISQGKTALANLDVSAVNRCILNAKTLIPNSPIPWHLQIRLLLKLHQYKLAIDAATTACHVYPSDSECLRLLAKSHQVAGLHQEAIEYYNRLILLSSRTLFDYDKINCSIAKSLLAIGAYDQALTLIQPIASSNPRNLKVTIVLGEILAKQGKLSEALHLVLRNFSVEPDHKRTRRFISEHVVNDLQIQILQSELGDGVIDSNILFYVGDMLNEFGSKYAAFHFLKLAFLISPNSPAIAVGCFKSAIENCITRNEIFELFDVFLSSIDKREDELKNLTKNLDLKNIKNDFELENVNENDNVKKFEIIKQGEIDCQYKFEQYDTIWIFILLESYLFNHYYITASNIIVNNINEIIKQYKFNKTILAKEIQYHYLISSLIPSISYPFKKEIINSKNLIYLIGDENYTFLSYRNVTINNENYFIYPKILDKLTFNELINNNYNKCFMKIINEIPENSLIIIAFSNYNNNIENNFNNLLNDFVFLLKNIWNEKHFNVWIAPVLYIRNKVCYNTKFQFKYAKRIWELNNEIPQIRYIELLKKLQPNDAGRIANDWTLEGYYLTPDLLHIVQESLNDKENHLEEYKAKKK